ncbi:hypothetical protein T4E_11394 [Trichinella pseudospiralis]|uniref:Uncharacterized protein n=1 Tax=Trichinella pseudospiralis TaxID=6337 RepID=A0A0V0YH06_TRIPS|nr:hypothetical protein T4E_11394 [Trichinella pseudospiralis]
MLLQGLLVARYGLVVIPFLMYYCQLMKARLLWYIDPNVVLLISPFLFTYQDPRDFPPVAWNPFFRDEDQIVYLRLVIHHGQLNSVFPLKIEGARSCRWKMMHFFTSWSPQITQNYLLKAANACLTSTCNSDSCVLLTLNSTISLSRGVLSAQFWLPVSDWLFTDRLYCSGSGDSRLSWLALTNGSKMLQNVLDYLPNNRVPHRPVVDEIYSSPSGPPPGFYVDELRDVSKILVSVDCRLELIQKEFKQQIPAIELWQKQTGGFLALLETPTVLPTHVSPLTPRSHLSPPRELRW